MLETRKAGTGDMRAIQIQSPQQRDTPDARQGGIGYAGECEVYVPQAWQGCEMRQAAVGDGRAL
jgi:hypothetical protein